MDIEALSSTVSIIVGTAITTIGVERAWIARSRRRAHAIWQKALVEACLENLAAFCRAQQQVGRPTSFEVRLYFPLQIEHWDLVKSQFMDTCRDAREALAFSEAFGRLRHLREDADSNDLRHTHRNVFALATVRPHEGGARIGLSIALQRDHGAAAAACIHVVRTWGNPAAKRKLASFPALNLWGASSYGIPDALRQQYADEPVDTHMSEMISSSIGATIKPLEDEPPKTTGAASGKRGGQGRRSPTRGAAG